MIINNVFSMKNVLMAFVFFCFVKGAVIQGEDEAFKTLYILSANYNDTTQAVVPRFGKYLIMSAGNSSDEPMKIGYFTLANNEYKYYDINEKLLNTGTYIYDTTGRQIKWESGPFKAIGWQGNFATEQNGKTHIVRLNKTTVAKNIIE